MKIVWLAALAPIYVVGEVPNCSALPPTSNSNVPVFSADYLYLGAREGGLDYATQTPIFTAARVVVGTVYAIEPGFSSGVEIRADYFVPNTPWDLKADWMYYQNTQNSSLSINDGINLINTSTGESVLWPYLLNPALDPVAKTASAHWTLQMNVADLAWGGE